MERDEGYQMEVEKDYNGFERFILATLGVIVLELVVGPPIHSFLDDLWGGLAWLVSGK